LDFLLLMTGPIFCPETSERNYHYTLRKSAKERSSPLLRYGSLKSRKELLNTIKRTEGLSHELNSIFHHGSTALLGLLYEVPRSHSHSHTT